MAFPNCKLISLTAPVGAPENVVLSMVVGEERVSPQKLTVQDGEFDFDNESFIPFQNEVQLKLGLNVLGGSHEDLGVVLIDASDRNKELTQRVSQSKPIYELTYKVL